MSTLTRSVILFSLATLLAGCGKGSPKAEDSNTAPPVAAEVAAMPQVANSDNAPSDFDIVMSARKGNAVTTADATAEKVDWSEVGGLELKLDEMGCAVQTNVPSHCHMVISQNQTTGAIGPDRDMLIVRTGNSYSLVIVTPKQPQEAIVCMGLTIKNPQVIEGTCAVTGDLGSGIDHSFAASIERTPQHKIRVHFAYRHGPFDSAEVAIHNGDGHATEP
jgi:hypothetical protein